MNDHGKYFNNTLDGIEVVEIFTSTMFINLCFNHYVNICNF